MLARSGVDVTIFEKEARGGGLMTYGVAAYKVTPEFCAEELDYILSVGGIEIKYGCALGVDVTLEELRRSYDAVFLGIGVGLGAAAGYPGRGVWMASWMRSGLFMPSGPMAIPQWRLGTRWPSSGWE